MDDCTPLHPGALTIQRLNLHHRSRLMGMDEDDLVGRCSLTHV